MDFNATINNVYISEHGLTLDLDIKHIKHEDFGWFYDYAKSQKPVNVKMVYPRSTKDE